MAYELTDTEKNNPGAPLWAAPSAADVQQMVGAVGGDPYAAMRRAVGNRGKVPVQSGPYGSPTESPTQALPAGGAGGQAQMNYPPRARTEKSVGDYGSAITKTVGADGRTTYTGKGSGGDEAADMAGRGMVRDSYGNWTPREGWEARLGGGESAPSILDQDVGGMEVADYITKYKPALKTYRDQQKQRRALELEGLRERGALSRMEREMALRGEQAEAERGAMSPQREVMTRLYGAQAGSAEAAADFERKLNLLRGQAASGKTPKERQDALDALTALGSGRKETTNQFALEKYKWQLENLKPGEEPPPVPYSSGGFVEGYADGGAVGNPSTGGVDPMVMQYGQYLGEASKIGIAPVPFAQYINLMQSARSMPKARFADGGDVSALQRPLEGPGTGRSDSIPAVIDGEQPAALSRGEFVLDEETTKYYGTKFLKDLQRKAKEALAGEGQETPSAAAVQNAGVN